VEPPRPNAKGPNLGPPTTMPNEIPAMNETRKIGEELFDDRNSYFRGTARVRFENLHFVYTHDRKVEDKKLIENLEDKFESEGCFPFEPKNRIPALVDQATLDSISNSIDQTALLDNRGGLPPELKVPSDISIECLDGRLRVQAAMKVLGAARLVVGRRFVSQRFVRS
jgi:hypothetical protein